MDPAALRAFPIPEVRQRYGPRDAVFYALSVGAAHWADRPRGLDALIDARGPSVLPTFPVVVGHPGFWLSDPATTVDARGVLHVGEGVRLLAPLPPAAEVIGRTRIVDIVDKGAGRGVLLLLEKEVVEAETGRRLALVTRTLMLRRDGGFSGTGAEGASGQGPGPASSSTKAAATRADDPPDFVERVPTRPEQALLYRLNGDDNPLHVEPEVARTAGFERPILHGLCTFAIAATAATHALAGGDPARVRAFSARFTAPVFPGEVLRVEIRRTGPGAAALEVFADAGDRRVLGSGMVEICMPDGPGGGGPGEDGASRNEASRDGASRDGASRDGANGDGAGT